jgi:hypothetical protein
MAVNTTRRGSVRDLGIGEGVWIPGHAPVSGGRTQLERQREVEVAVPTPPPAIALHFRVDSYTRQGHYFDMESLGYVVLATWRHDLAQAPRPVKLPDPFRPDSIWLTMSATEGMPGLLIVHEPPPDPNTDRVLIDVDIADPPGVSVRGTIIPELEGYEPMEESPWLGLDISFGPGADIAEFGFNGPIKPFIDAMSPLLGRDRRGGPADHRLHDLRIHRVERGSGARLRAWYVD